MLAFDKAKEARIAHKETKITSMDKKIYELEVQRTKNLGNMISALLMLASSMDALTRSCAKPYAPSNWHHFTPFLSPNPLQCGSHFVDELDSPKGLLLLFGLLAMLCPH